jgi:hypothetical protein
MRPTNSRHIERCVHTPHLSAPTTDSSISPQSRRQSAREARISRAPSLPATRRSSMCPDQKRDRYIPTAQRGGLRVIRRSRAGGQAGSGWWNVGSSPGRYRLTGALLCQERSTGNELKSTSRILAVRRSPAIRRGCQFADASSNEARKGSSGSRAPAARKGVRIPARRRRNSERSSNGGRRHTIVLEIPGATYPLSPAR